MVQTNLSMFLKEDTPNYGENNIYVHHPYILTFAVDHSFID